MSQALKKRLDRIWEPANFEPLFTSIKKQSNFIRKKTILFNNGDPLERVYFIQEGFVKLYRLSEEGKETTIYPLGPGDLLGLRSLTSKDKCAKHTAETLTNIKMISLSHQEFLEKCLEKPAYLIDLLHLYINRLIYTETRLEAFIATDSTTRVAIFLNYCAKRFGKATGGEITLPIALTHQLIAEFIGSIRETVTISLNRLEKKNILKTEKGKITILDIAQLRNYQK